MEWVNVEGEVSYSICSGVKRKMDWLNKEYAPM